MSSADQLLDTMLGRGWALHVEPVGFGRTAAGEGEALWVASLTRKEFALEADGRSPAAAVEGLHAEVLRFIRQQRAPEGQRAR